MTTSQLTDLEVLIDTYSLSSVLAEIAHICTEKAEHVRTSWQDYPLARTWDIYSRKLNKISSAIGHNR